VVVRTASIDPCLPFPAQWPTLFLGSQKQMGVAAKDHAEIDLEELLSSAWAAQVARLNAPLVSAESKVGTASQEMTGKEGDAR
jgi:hypothetical protein